MEEVKGVMNASFLREGSFRKVSLLLSSLLLLLAALLSRFDLVDMTRREQKTKPGRRDV